MLWRRTRKIYDSAVFLAIEADVLRKHIVRRIGCGGGRVNEHHTYPDSYLITPEATT